MSASLVGSEMCIRDRPPPAPLVCPDGGRPPSCLRNFSGPSRRRNGLSAVLRRVGWGVLDVDAANDGDGPSPRDLSSDEV
eukprot:12536572-Alexandrium_andersonii.AAC.1